MKQMQRLVEREGRRMGMRRGQRVRVPTLLTNATMANFMNAVTNKLHHFLENLRFLRRFQLLSLWKCV